MEPDNTNMEIFLMKSIVLWLGMSVKNLNLMIRELILAQILT